MITNRDHQILTGFDIVKGKVARVRSLCLGVLSGGHCRNQPNPSTTSFSTRRRDFTPHEVADPGKFYRRYEKRNDNSLITAPYIHDFVHRVCWVRLKKPDSSAGPPLHQQRREALRSSEQNLDRKLQDAWVAVRACQFAEIYIRDAGIRLSEVRAVEKIERFKAE